MRATSSPRTIRTLEPAESSVISISESAVESQLSLRLPARFRNPSTAIVGRMGNAGRAAVLSGRFFRSL